MFFPFAASAFTFPSSELNALRDLYISTEGSSWDWKYPLITYGNIWNFSVPSPNPCADNWQGITCSSKCTTSPCYVLELSLAEYDLKGTLPDTLNGLTELTILEIIDNGYLGGTIPSTLTDIVSLQQLILYSNALTGSLPSSMDSWINLQVLNLATNHDLTSSLPSSFCDLQSLTFLQLSQNYFTGRIPECFGKLTKLTNIYIISSLLSGPLPNSIVELTQMQYFEISESMISGTIPNEIGRLHQCLEFELSDLPLEGTIPASIGNMTNLVTLYLAETRLEGTIPVNISQCTKLEYLYLFSNGLTGSIDNDMLTDLTMLNVFELENNFLSGKIPPNLATLPLLTAILLYNNSLTGSIPSGFINSINLIFFEIQINLLTNTIPSDLFLAPNIVDIFLSDNLLSGTLPAIFGNQSVTFKTLMSLYIFGTLLTGSIPNGMGPNFHSLNEFGIGTNYLSGTLPPSIGSFPKLVFFYADENMLSGSLPTTITNLTKLTALSFADNYITGTLPRDMGKMKGLVSFVMANNRLTGSIPHSVVNCTSIITFDLDINRLTGSIPDGFEAWSDIFYFAIDGNLLTGTLAPGLFINKPILEVIYLAVNFLTGTLPEQMTLSLPDFGQFDFSFNMLSGTIPENIGDNPKLSVIYLMNNEMTGTIPASVYTTNNMYLLYLFDNQFTGRINPVIANATSLEEFDIHHNYITSTIPSSMLTLPRLYFAYLEKNLLTGTIPFDQASPTVLPLAELLVNENMLSGTISSSIKNFPFMISMNISSNHFHGSLPSTIRDLRILTVVDVSNNAFTGPLTGRFDSSETLISCFAENNQFTGKLQDVFNHTTQNTLLYVDVSNNRMSGSLSGEFFNAQNMSSFAAVKNCLTGSIPEEICTNRFMEALALDGLHTAKYCQERIVEGLSAYLLNDAISGSIPSCLFHMVRLNTLHLSGNGMHGTIPLSDSDVLYPALSDLSLSHNALTGSIPLAIQYHEWFNLDLSFNRLSGKLASSMLVGKDINATKADVKNVSVTLTVNRLSGGVPNSIVNVEDISILQGNLFGCPIVNRKGHLPKHDHYYNSYQCGSNMVDIPTIMWAIVLLLSLVIAGYAYRAGALHMVKLEEGDATEKKSIAFRIYGWWTRRYRWWSVFNSDYHGRPISLRYGNTSPLLTPSNHNNFAESLAMVRSLSIQWSIVVLVVFLPMYSILGIWYSTHEYVYAWIISLAYLEGIVPAFVTLSVFLVSYFAMEYQTLYWLLAKYGHQVIASEKVSDSTQIVESKNSEQDHANDVIETNEKVSNENFNKRISNRKAKCQWLLLSTVVVLGNLIFVLAVNASYVYSTTLSLSPTKQGVITIAITLFKIVWTSVIVARWVSNLFQRTMEAFLVGYEDDSDKRIVFERYLSRCLVFLSLFNNVIAPCLAILLVSPECFLYVITTPNEVSVSYKFFQCEGIYNTVKRNICADKTINKHSTSYSPAFSYGYQCSSSLLGGFVDIYLYRYLLSGLVFPLWFALLQSYQQRFFVKKLLKIHSDDDGGMFGIDDNDWKWKFYVLLSKLLPSAMRVMDVDSIAPLVEEVATVDGSRATVFTVDNPIVSQDFSKSTPSMVGNLMVHSIEVPSNDQRQISVNPTFAHALLNVTVRVLPTDKVAIFDARRTSTILVGDLAIFLTFGVIYPPLAIVVAISVVLSTYNIQTVLGRFLVLVAPLMVVVPNAPSIERSSVANAYREQLILFIETIQEETRKVGSLFVLSMAPITVLATIFWSFFLFDILGGKVGTRKALWILFVIPGVLVLMRSILAVFSRAFYKKPSSILDQERTRSKQVSTNGVELRDSSVFSNHLSERF